MTGTDHDLRTGLRFHKRGDEVWRAALGVWIVGLISQPNAGGPFLWRCFLPGCRETPQPAASFDKARGALVHAVANWTEAAGYVLSAAATARIEKERRLNDVQVREAGRD